MTLRFGRYIYYTQITASSINLQVQYIMRAGIIACYAMQ